MPAECPEVNVVVEQPDGIGAYLPEQQTAVWHNQQTRNWGAVPGSLAESVRCTVAVGTGAAVAAARPFGRVDRYAPELPENPRELLASCVLSIVDLGTVSGDDPQARRMAAAAADAQLARVLAARPADSLVVVAGLADTDQTNRLHVVVADGPGWEGRWLTSASTGRPGYVQLVDLAPTALTVLDRQIPERRFIGHALAPAQERPADLADGDRRARRRRRRGPGPAGGGRMVLRPAGRRPGGAGGGESCRCCAAPAAPPVRSPRFRSRRGSSR